MRERQLRMVKKESRPREPCHCIRSVHPLRTGIQHLERRPHHRSQRRPGQRRLHRQQLAPSGRRARLPALLRDEIRMGL